MANKIEIHEVTKKNAFLKVSLWNKYVAIVYGQIQTKLTTVGTKGGLTLLINNSFQSKFYKNNAHSVTMVTPHKMHLFAFCHKISVINVDWSPITLAILTEPLSS